jgi:large subunit ribosomal protein L17
MRHGKKVNHLGRQYGHRQALLSNMASSLILNKRINTTLAKAKALRKYVEPLLTRAKDDSTHSRRMVFKYLQDKPAVAELFREVAPKIADRPGGYTRIIKLENRLGDNAEMCMMELVDFNLLMLGDGASASSPKKAGKTTRRRGAKKKTSAAEAETGAESETEEVKAPKAKATKKPAAKKKSDESEEKKD